MQGVWVPTARRWMWSESENCGKRSQNIPMVGASPDLSRASDGPSRKVKTFFLTTNCMNSVMSPRDQIHPGVQSVGEWLRGNSWKGWVWGNGRISKPNKKKKKKEQNEPCFFIFVLSHIREVNFNHLFHDTCCPTYPVQMTEIKRLGKMAHSRPMIMLTTPPNHTGIIRPPVPVHFCCHHWQWPDKRVNYENSDWHLPL